jgi:uncharacterized protein YceH (UPF0502 family)
VKPELAPLEARVIGCLIEKDITTPDQYPLTLNALTHAVNQRSNRDPVLSIPEVEVHAVVDGLMKKHLVTDRSGGMGGRVTRYRHRFCNTQFSQLSLSPQELAIVCELLLRGPQTPGELRGRAQRMAPIAEVGEVEAALESLAGRDEPLVARLPREAGRRESRWMQLFTGNAPETVPGAPRTPESISGATPDRLADLESTVVALRNELEQLRARLEAIEARGREPG